VRSTGRGLGEDTGAVNMPFRDTPLVMTTSLLLFKSDSHEWRGDWNQRMKGHYVFKGARFQRNLSFAVPLARGPTRSDGPARHNKNDMVEFIYNRCHSRHRVPVSLRTSVTCCGNLYLVYIGTEWSCVLITSAAPSQRNQTARLTTTL